LMLAATEGVRLVISATGQDEEEAVQAICSLFESRFGEDN
jgi:phosphotransferase system HPr-like phosphotransfer protein